MPTTTALTVTSTERLSPGMVRVHFHSDDLSAFADSPHTDRYVKLVFGSESDDDQPVLRTYTAIEPDIAAGSVAIDFVIQGDDGVAGSWGSPSRGGADPDGSRARGRVRPRPFCRRVSR